MKKKPNPRNRTSTWEKVKAAHLDGQNAGIEYAFYTSFFVLKDSYDYSHEKLYELIWRCQEDLNVLNGSKTIRIPGLPDHVFPFGAQIQRLYKKYTALGFEFLPIVPIHLFKPEPRPATVADEIFWKNNGTRLGMDAMRITLLRNLDDMGDFNLQELKEYQRLYNHWDEMQRTGYATQKEFREACRDEYEFMISAKSKDLPDDYDPDDPSAQEYAEFVRNKRQNSEK